MALRRLRDAQRFVEAQTNFSKFEVLDLVGTGANGVVFRCRARDPKVKGEMALKVVINYGADPQVLLDSAVQEQSSISHLPPHRNIVEILGIVGPAPIPQEIFDVCPDLMKEASSRNDAVGIVMRYHPQDLEHCITKNEANPTLSSYDIFGMCLDVVLALRHLQRYNSLHFDVKLNNFLVSKDNTLVLADFGCAQQTTRDDWVVALPADSTNVGNSSHLAPEVLCALQDARSMSPRTTGRRQQVDTDNADDDDDGRSGGGGGGGGGGAAAATPSAVPSFTGNSGSVKKPARYFLPCRRQLEFAAGVLLFELLFPKCHPYQGYPLNLHQLLRGARVMQTTTTTTTTTTTQMSNSSRSSSSGIDDGARGSPPPDHKDDDVELVNRLQTNINNKIAGLRASGFSAEQQRSLQQVLQGLLQIDPARRMSLDDAVRVLGSVDKGSQSTTAAATSRLLEIWVLGASFVGKSMLMTSFTGATYTPVTVGVNSSWRNVRPGMPKGFQVRIWDTAGQRIFRNSMAGLTSRDAFVMLVFDVTAPDTFDEVRTIHAQLLEKGRMAACVVVANKIDLVGERKVSYVQGLQLAEELGAEGYFETSATSEEGVNELFLSICQIADGLDRIIAKANPGPTEQGGLGQLVVENDVTGSTTSTTPQQPRRKKGCC